MTDTSVRNWSAEELAFDPAAWLAEAESRGYLVEPSGDTIRYMEPRELPPDWDSNADLDMWRRLRPKLPNGDPDRRNTVALIAYVRRLHGLSAEMPKAAE